MSSIANQLALPSGERPADSSTTVYGLLVVAAAALVFIGGIAGAYLALRSGTAVWPPKGVLLEDYFGNMLSVTLLLSGFTGWWALYAIRRGESRQATISLALVIFLEAAFINLSTYVLAQGKFGPGTSVYGTIYFALNGAAIAFAGTGIVVAIVTLARVLGGQVNPRTPAMGWVVAWYSSFVTVAWLVVYALIYQVK